MYHLPYNKNLKEISRLLRNNSTLGEVLLWQQLRAGGMCGYTFNRQKPLDEYIVDFYCRPLQVVIEVDGPYHLEGAQRLKDAERQAVLEKMGLFVLRFLDDEVRLDMELVLRKIREYIVAFEAAHPDCKPTVRGKKK